MKTFNQKIRKRRTELRLSDIVVAEKCGLSIHEYSDVEQHADEIMTAVPLKKVKQICDILSINLLDLLEIQCEYCLGKESYDSEHSLPLNRLISVTRTSMGISKDELADRLGFFIDAVDEMEEDENYLENWPIDIITNLSNELNLPIQILLGVRCDKCGR